jgi:hypothetical protein
LYQGGVVDRFLYPTLPVLWEWSMLFNFCLRPKTLDNNDREVDGFPAKYWDFPPQKITALSSSPE